MNKNESKYFNTAVLMDEALIRLLEKKDIRFITVKEICEKAGVNRSTFYLHYETIGDLLEETVDYITGKLMSTYKEISNDFISKIETAKLSELVLINQYFLRPYLEFVKENKTVFKAVNKNPQSLNVESQYSYIRKYVLNPIMNRFKIPQREQKYWACYYVNGIIAVIQEWIKDDCKEPVSFIEEIIINCVRPYDTEHNKNQG
jgi:AcrR family transcriptional regulator